MSNNTKIFKGPGSIQIPRLSADPAGTPVNGEIYYNTTSDKFRQYVNGAWANVVDETSISSFSANKTLSNLTNPVALNEDILPASDNSRNLGASATRFANVYSSNDITNSLKVKDSGSANSVNFSAPSLSASTNYVLPAADGSANQVLKTDGAGNLDWVTAGGSGANVTLSNLTNPTAVNQDLIFNKANGTLKTQNKTSTTNSEHLFLNSGAVVDGTSGDASVISGDASGDGVTGNVYLASGVPSATATGGASGTVNIFSANVANPNVSNSGLIVVHSGSVDSGNSGSVQLYSGDSAAGVSGTVSVYSGQSSSGANDSGTVSIYSGAVDTGDSGAVILSSGNASGTTGTSGAISISTGTSVDGNVGAISLTTGEPSGNSNSGDINLTSGNSSSGSSGSINLTVGQTVSTAFGNIVLTGKAVQSTNPTNGFVNVIASIGLSNGQNTLHQIRLQEKTLAASTASATLISGYTWADNNYGSAKLQYQMTEVSTGKVRRGTLYMVQDYNTAADVAYTDVVEVENASFPNVVLSVVSTGGNIEIRYTNASANNVYFNSLTQLEPIAVGTV